MDNDPKAPVIPAGTEPNVFGKSSFPTGQADKSPVTDKSGGEGEPPTGEPKAPGTTFEELAAKKGFKSADDLALAYQNLEAQNKRVEMGLAEMVKLRTEAATAPSEEDIQVDPSQEYAIKVVEKIVRKATRPLEDKLALQDLFFRNPDAKDYAAEIAQIVKENPNVSWEVAYKAAKFDASQAIAKQEGKKEAYQELQKKQSAAVAPSKTSVGGSDIKSVQELIRDKSIPFAEVQRIMKERFSQ